MTSMSRSILTAVYAVLRRRAHRFDRSVDPLLVTDMRALRVTDALASDTRRMVTDALGSEIVVRIPKQMSHYDDA